MKRPKEVEGGAPSSTSDTYGPHMIEPLEGLEPVRKRPGMYIGNVQDGSGLHQLVWEVVGNAVDEHLARRARRMSVDLNDGWIEVADDGAGIPVDVHPRWGRTALELVCTTLHSGPTRWGHHPHVHVGEGQLGFGLAVVNALSGRLEVEVQRDGGVHRVAFERGRVVEPFARTGKTTRTGTRVRLRPDPETFATCAFDPAAIEARLRELAWLCPLLEIRWQGVELPGRGGPLGWARTAGQGPARAQIATTPTIDHATVDLALVWRDDGDATIRSFVNFGATRDGGTHVGGLWDGLVEAVAPRWPTATSADLRAALGRGLSAVVHVMMVHPSWGGPTKDKLVSPEAGDVTRRAAREAVTRALWSGSPLVQVLHERLG